MGGGNQEKKKPFKERKRKQLISRGGQYPEVREECVGRQKESPGAITVAAMVRLESYHGNKLWRH